MRRGSLIFCRACGHWYDVTSSEDVTRHENGDCRNGERVFQPVVQKQNAEGANHCPHGYLEATKASCEACNPDRESAQEHNADILDQLGR